MEVLDDHVVRLDRGIGDGKHMQFNSAIVFGERSQMEDIMWTQGEGRIWTIGTALLGQSTSFRKDFTVSFHFSFFSLTGLLERGSNYAYGP